MSSVEMRVPRSHDRDLRFRGLRIGQGIHTGALQVRVDVFRTTAAHYVVHETRTSATEVRHASHVCLTPTEVLKGRSNGQLGPASRAAWEACCRADSAFAADECEVLA
jgi:hypothetical protein